MLLRISAIFTAMTFIFINSAQAVSVYSWKDNKGITAYSDTPNGLKIKGTNTLNVRTQTVSIPRHGQPTLPTSIADQQVMLSQQIAAQNRQVEMENAKIKAERDKIREENCRNAQSNRKLAENARNRDQLITKYEQDIAANCN